MRRKTVLIAFASCAVLGGALLYSSSYDDADALRALSGVWVCEGPPFHFVGELEDAKWREQNGRSGAPAPISELVARNHAEYQVSFAEPVNSILPGHFRRGVPGAQNEFAICAKATRRKGEFNVGQPDGERCWISEDRMTFAGDLLVVRALYPLAVSGATDGWQTTQCKRGLAR